jgi:hypothetical protein
VAEYTHVPVGQEVAGIGGRYAVMREHRLAHGGREVLVVVGCAIVDASCCGPGGVAFANVPGYLVRFHARAAAVSEVERVADEGARREIAALVKQSEPYCQVNFY